MALTRITIPKNYIKPRSLESSDIRDAFMRAAKQRWGDDCPLVVKSVRAESIKVAAPSAPWCAEVVWSRQEMVEDINIELGSEVVKKIVVWWE